MRPFLIFVLLFAVAAVPRGAGGQTTEPSTRAEALQQQREEKQRSLTPNRPDNLQRGMDFAEDRALLILTRENLYPKIGTLTTGSGFAFGVGFRDRDLFKRRGRIELWSAASVKKYWAVEATVAGPDVAEPRVFGSVVAGRREYPEEDYFGLGPDSHRDDRSTFLLRQSQVSATGGFRLAEAVSLGGILGFLQPRTGDGKNSSVPTTDQIFDSQTAPGLGALPDYLQSSAFVTVDYREPPYARRGGWYRFTATRHSDLNDGEWSFTRTDVDLRQFIGFLAERRVIALRGHLASTFDTGDSSGVPFFMMPWLGGNDSLRGFRNYRFRAPHALLLQAEYRWEIWSGLDGALFYDTGQVAMKRSDFKLGQFESDYGFGFRFNTSNSVILRVDAAFGSGDGAHLHIVFGGVF